jgi:ketosteroid isomerase-like protein
MTSKNLTIVKAFLSEFNSGSLDKALSMLADDAVWSIAQTRRGVSMSKSELADRVATMRESFDQNMMSMTTGDFIEEGDRICLEATGSALTNLGKRYENKYCLIFRISGEKIADVKEYNDSLHVVEVLIPAVEHTLAHGR